MGSFISPPKMLHGTMGDRRVALLRVYRSPCPAFETNFLMWPRSMSFGGGLRRSSVFSRWFIRGVSFGRRPTAMRLNELPLVAGHAETQAYLTLCAPEREAAVRYVIAGQAPRATWSFFQGHGMRSLIKRISDGLNMICFPWDPTGFANGRSAIRKCSPSWHSRPGSRSVTRLGATWRHFEGPLCSRKGAGHTRCLSQSTGHHVYMLRLAVTPQSLPERAAVSAHRW